MARLFRPFMLLSAMVLLAQSCTSGNPTLSGVVERYDRELFATAQTMGERLARQSHGEARAEVAYVTGMAAMRQSGRTEAARTWLIEACRTNEPSLRARAEAMLGELDRREGNELGAIRHYERAWPGLTLTQRRDAAQAAILALRAAGDVEGVEAWTHRLAGSDAAPDETQWTLQAGAFKSRSAADDLRRALLRQSSGNGLSSPRIHRRTRAGRELWLVQLGGFQTRAQAESARRRLNETDLLIVRVE
jgi:hypothetical protein